MAVEQSRPLTKRSDRPLIGDVAPFLVAVAALALIAFALVRLDPVYERLPGVYEPWQLAPGPLEFQHELRTIRPGAPEGRVRREAADVARVRGALAEPGAELSVRSWREGASRTVVVGIAEVENAARRARRLRARGPLSAARLPRQTAARTWAVGDRFVVALTVTTPGTRVERAAFADERAEQVEASIGAARIAWWELLALGPLVVPPALVLIVYLGIGVVQVASFLVTVVLLLLSLLVWIVGLPLRLIGIRLPGRRPKVFARRERGPKPKLAPNVEFVDLDREAARFGSLTPPGVLTLVFSLAVYLALAVAVAIPVLTRSLWTASLFWGALGATVPLILFHTARRLRWIRPLAWAVPALAVLELANVLLGIGPGVPTDNPAALPVAVVVLTCAAALAWWAAAPRESMPTYAPWYSDLDVRSGAYMIGLAGITLAGCALFLGSNGDGDVGSQITSKVLAAGGLLIVPVIGRRVRAAREAARREWARERKVPEVLLLRSFVDDGLRVRSRALKRRQRVEMLIPARRELFEDVVVRAFEVLGPVVAIARPGTGQTEFGAARDVIIVPDWLTAVRHAMESAAYIVAILGRGEGLERELETLKELKLLDRVCLLVPPIADDDAAERLRRATAAVDGDGGWGRLEVSSMEDPTEEQAGTRQVLALLGAGERRYVVTCRERDAASTYLQLGAILSEKERLGATGRG